MNRLQYVLDDGGTIEDVLVQALISISANLGNPRDCPAERWASSKAYAADALVLYQKTQFKKGE